MYVVWIAESEDSNNNNNEFFQELENVHLFQFKREI